MAINRDPITEINKLHDLLKAIVEVPVHCKYTMVIYTPMICRKAFVFPECSYSRIS